MSPPCLLLIEDDRAVAEVITEALTEAGYTIRHVSSPERALAHLRMAPPLDLVLKRLGGVCS